MNSVRVYHYLAKSNVVFGVLSGAVAGGGFAAALLSESQSNGFMWMAVFIIAGIMAGSLIHSAYRHISRPSRKSASEIASNTAFFLWALITAILGFSPLNDFIGSTYILVGPIVAFIVHVLILQPLALWTSLPRNSDSTSGRFFRGLALCGKVFAVLGLGLFWVWTSTFGPIWPGIREPTKLRNEATLLCQSYPDEVPREKWPEGIAALKPRGVLAKRESVTVIIGGSSFSGHSWGFIIWPNTAQRSDRGITKYDEDLPY